MLACVASPTLALAQGNGSSTGNEGADLAKQLSNPIANLISVPLQYNYNGGYGDGSGNWETEEWAVPINFVVSQVVKLGKQPVQFGPGARYWADSPDGGPEGWGARFQVTFLFPK